MPFTQPDLPYAKNSLTGFISEECFDYHYGKHHAAYFTNLNKLVVGTEWADRELEDVVTRCPLGGIFNNSAQAWNHSFFWNCLSPNGGGEPSGPLADAINASFGSFDSFKEQFSKAAVTLFGSGWVWLAQDESGKLSIMALSNADTPLRHEQRPILTLDVWEHAYYIDYRNARPQFVEKFWDVVNWDFAAGELR